MKTKRFLRNERGMSILEMIIVVVLVGLMASLALPSWLEQMPRMETKTQVREFVSKLREARSLAIARKTTAGLACDTYKNTWTIFLDNNPADKTFNVGDSVLSTGPFGNRVAMSYNNFSNQSVLFDSDGSAIESGALCFMSSDNTLSFTVGVLAATGRVKMVEGFYPYEM